MKSHAIKFLITIILILIPVIIYSYIHFYQNWYGRYIADSYALREVLTRAFFLKKIIMSIYFIMNITENLQKKIERCDDTESHNLNFGNCEIFHTYKIDRCEFIYFRNCIEIGIYEGVYNNFLNIDIMNVLKNSKEYVYLGDEYMGSGFFIKGETFINRVNKLIKNNYRIYLYVLDKKHNVVEQKVLDLR